VAAPEASLTRSAGCPMIWRRGNGSRGGARVFGLFGSVPSVRVFRCGQCRWLQSSLRVAPAVTGGHGAGPRQVGAVRRGQSRRRPRCRGGGADKSATSRLTAGQG
jgi:hypothetical protein